MDGFTMGRTGTHLLVSTLLATLLPFITATPLPDRVFVRNDTSLNHNNQTIADLVQHQTDTIKRIVSNHHVDYPVITKHSPQNKQKPSDHASIEDLKIKCQHLARLISTSTPTPRNNTGFYVTTDAPPLSSTTPKATPPVKYIKLEPVILQKTMMSDGRTIYYWHKSIPSQVVPVQTPPTTTPSTTTTSGYNFRNFFPSFYSAGGSESVGATTTEKAPTQESGEDLQLYQQQLKFVVPVPYAPPEEQVVRKPWEIDQYAYYPKPLQPESVNMQVPYVPTFHIIKTLVVPKEYESTTTKNLYI